MGDSKKWRLKNLDHRREWERLYRLKNAERCRERNRFWSKKRTELRRLAGLGFHKLRIPLICAGCGLIFFTRPSTQRKFCSRGCYFNSGLFNPIQPRVDVVHVNCSHCGADVIRRQKELNRVGKIFCSVKCMALSRVKPLPVCACGNSCKEHRAKWCSKNCPKRAKLPKDFAGRKRYYRETLHDTYIKKLLLYDSHRGKSTTLSSSDITPELIEVKRKQVELKRLLKQKGLK